MLVFRKFSFWLAILGVALTAKLVLSLRKETPKPAPMVQPAMAPYAKSVAATGIVEAAEENVKIATSKAGLIVEIPVKVSSQVKKGDLLLRLDDREVQARLKTHEAEKKSLSAQLETEKVSMADAKDQLDRIQKLKEEQAATEEEWKRKVYQLEATQSKIRKVELDIESSQRAMQQDEAELSLLSIFAPR
ncbi:MAG: biotin/lipoyl-binding protein, partial [Verrucomicrobiota bacterium]